VTGRVPKSTGALPAGSSTAEPPPTWLPNGYKVTIIRGGRGYALLSGSRASATPCEQRVEIRSASGQSCGSVTFRTSDAACETGEINVGPYGTVVQQAGQKSCAGDACTCTHRWWPRMFQ